MKKLKLSQAEIDKLVTVERRVESSRRVFGAGVNTVDFEVVVAGDFIWQYRMWKSMIQRCFDAKTKSNQPTYQDVTVCEEWLSFANFVQWVNKEVSYKGKPVGMALDKDIISKGNMVYSPDFCSIVPRAANNLLTSCMNARGKWPVGVCFDRQNGSFRAAFRCGIGKKNLGNYPTPEDAFAAYKTAKEAHIKVVALQYKDVLKSTVFDSLMNWEIEP